MTLAVRDVHVRYRRADGEQVDAVAGVSLEIARGEIVGLVGETGCGKSSLARVAAGFLAPAAGIVLLNDLPLQAIGHRSRPAAEVAVQMIFQDPFSSLNPRRRVADQLEDAARAGRSRRGHDLSPGDLLELVGLPAEAANRYPHEFSGGQCQRIAIARAIGAEPTFIIADEPISALDASAQAQIANLLVELARVRSMGMLIISHDLAAVGHLADTVAVMYLGRIVEIAPRQRMQQSLLHPYARALVNAVPRHDGAGVMPDALRGEVPDPAHPPVGCRFHPRCPLAFERCGLEEPPSFTQAEGGEVACWLSSPEYELALVRSKEHA